MKTKFRINDNEDTVVNIDLSLEFGGDGVLRLLARTADGSCEQIVAQFLPNEGIRLLTLYSAAICEAFGTRDGGKPTIIGEI